MRSVCVGDLPVVSLPVRTNKWKERMTCYAKFILEIPASSRKGKGKERQAN